MGHGEGMCTNLSHREAITEEGSITGEQVIITEAEVREGLGNRFMTISAVKHGYLDGGTPS